MYDIITTLGNSLIQHGSFNDRIYLMKLSQDDFPDIISRLDALASEKGYTKIFAKIPASAREIFLAGGYELEAHIPGFYNGKESAYFLGKYFSETRKQVPDSEKLKNVLDTAKAKSRQKTSVTLPANYVCRECRITDVPDITDLYKKVFETYPFPIHNPEYITATMKNNVTYFGVWYESRLVSLASTEMDLSAENVEMTDFATLPEYRGQNLPVFLLDTMETYVKKIGLKTAYTISRSLSYGINITFAKMGYLYSGTLINNTNISGNLESMNIWYKSL